MPCFNVVSFTSGTSVLSVTVARASLKLKLVWRTELKEALLLNCKDLGLRLNGQNTNQEVFLLWSIWIRLSSR